MSFAVIQSCTESIFPSGLIDEPSLLHYSNVLWLRGHAALYDGTTGLALPGTFLTRFPYQQQAPDCSLFRVEITGPSDTFHCLDRALLIPSAECGDFGRFITETMAFVWPLLSDARSSVEGYPVLLRGCDDLDPAAAILHALCRATHAFPVLERDLPPVVVLNEVVVPEPSLRLKAWWSPHHLRSLSRLADWLLGWDGQAASGKPDAAMVYLSRSGAGQDAHCVEQEQGLEALLAQLGWLIFHPEMHSLSELLAVVRSASVLAGFECSALHALGCVDPDSPPPALILLGDCPSPDYFLQFRAQGLRGFFVHCTSAPLASDRSAEGQSRYLNCAVESLVPMIHELANVCLAEAGS